MSAYKEIQEMLFPDEKVERIVFGAWGGNWFPDDDGKWKREYGEPEDTPVPLNQRGKMLTWNQAFPYMRSWSFLGDYGSAECYATYIWTNQRIIWVSEYDGATGLASAPRNPCDVVPCMD